VIRFLWCVLGYSAAVALLRVTLGRPPFVMADVWVPLFAVAGGAMWLAVALVRRSVANAGDAAVTLALATLLTLTFAGGRTILPVYWADPMLERAEVFIHFGETPFYRMVPFLTAHPAIAHAIWFNYHAYYLLLAIAVPAFIAVLPPSANRTRFMWASLFNVVLLAHLTAAAFGSRGPVYHDACVPDMLRGMGLTTLVAGQEAYRQSANELLGITAAPSMHLAITTHWLLVARAWRRWTLWITGPYVAFMLVGSVVTGWHWALDGYAGIVGACLTWWLAGKVKP
jgi:hypothetical protein